MGSGHPSEEVETHLEVEAEKLDEPERAVTGRDGRRQHGRARVDVTDVQPLDRVINLREEQRC